MTSKLWEALDALRQHGWTRGSLGDRDHGFCLIGALRHVHGEKVKWTRGLLADERMLKKIVAEQFPSYAGVEYGARTQLEVADAA